MVRKRTGHRRLFLVLMFCSVFLIRIAQASLDGDVFVAFVLKAPIKFSTKDITDLDATGSAIGLVGNMVGILVLKKLLKVRDTTVVVLASSRGCSYGLRNGSSVAVPIDGSWCSGGLAYTYNL